MDLKFSLPPREENTYFSIVVNGTSELEFKVSGKVGADPKVTI